MNYRITLIDRPQREARIRKALESPKGIEPFFDYKSEKTMLKIVRLPVDLPVYRMENHRTFSAQAAHVARNHTPAAFFSAGQENESAQQIQHEILWDFARRGTTSVVPIVDVLQSEEQRENLLITAGGIVVNGNRRLAAMRELSAGDGNAFRRFEYVDCMVLPADATAEDILDIEGRLQARPETRLDYDWIGDAQLLSAMLRVHGSPDAVAKVLGRGRAEVKNVLQALGEADLYLQDWVRAPGEYDRVAEDGQQLFKDLAAQVQGLPTSLQDGCRAIAWALFDNRSRLTGRLYNYNVAFGKRAEDVLEQLSEQLGVTTTTGAQAETDDFEIDIETTAVGADFRPVAALLRPGVATPETLEALVGICDGAIEAERDKKSGGAALKAISSANAKLAEVDLTRAAPDTYAAIAKQLNAVRDRAAALEGSLDRLRAPQAN